MKLSLIIAFIVFVVSLFASVLLGLLMIWQDSRQPSAEEMFRLMTTSVIITIAALLYIGAGDAMLRILATNRDSSSGDKR